MDPVSANHTIVTEANRKYHDAQVGSYESMTHAGVPHYDLHVRAYLRDVIAALPSPPSECLALDAGAGTGFFTRMLLEKGFCVRAVEISEGMRAELVARCTGFPKLEVLDQDILAVLADGGDRYDVISFVSVLHHLYDYCDVLARSAERLAPGGILFTTCDPVRAHNPSAARLLQAAEHAVLVAANPRRLAGRLLGKRKSGGAASEWFRLAEYHAQSGIDLAKVESTLRSAGLTPLRIDRNPSSYWAWMRRVQSSLRAGGDLAMVWQKPL